MSIWSARNDDKRVADEASASYMACSFCGKQTLKSTLSEYGARCFECFEAYCRNGDPPVRLTDEDKAEVMRKLLVLASNFGRPADPKAWAYALRDREQSGERLSRVQRDSWRKAIGEAA